jgi:hypothetical protein
MTKGTSTFSRPVDPCLHGTVTVLLPEGFEARNPILQNVLARMRDVSDSNACTNRQPSYYNNGISSRDGKPGW